MRTFLRYVLSIIEKIEYYYIKVKTRFYYALIFQHIGKGGSVFSPLRLINPQNVYMGSGVYLYKNARIETIERWGNVEYTPHIVIGNNVSFEQNLHMTCANSIFIGDNTTILASVMISDINHSYQKNNIRIMQQPLEVKAVYIGNCCFIGMGSKVMPGSKLGDHCIVGANAIVTGEFPGYVVLVGIPAKIVKRYDFERKFWRKTNAKGEFTDEI